MINREKQVFLPMYDLLKGLQGDGGFVKVVRRWKMWTDVGAEEQPWLCMAGRPSERGEQVNRGVPARWVILMDLWVYAKVKDNQSRDEVLNPLLDRLTAPFDWVPPDGQQTLGGQVHWAKLDGEIVKSGGILDEQAIAIVPISVILPGAPLSGVTA